MLLKSFRIIFTQHMKLKLATECLIPLFHLNIPYIKTIYRSTWLTQLGTIAIILYGKYEDPLKSIDFNDFAPNSYNNSSNFFTTVFELIRKKLNLSGDYDYWSQIDYTLLFTAIFTISLSYVITRKMVINLSTNSNGSHLYIERLGLLSNKITTVPISSVKEISPLAPNKVVYMKLKTYPLTLTLSKRGIFSNTKTFNYLFGIRYHGV